MKAGVFHSVAIEITTVQISANVGTISLRWSMAGQGRAPPVNCHKSFLPLNVFDCQSCYATTPGRFTTDDSAPSLIHGSTAVCVLCICGL